MCRGAGPEVCTGTRFFKHATDSLGLCWVMVMFVSNRLTSYYICCFVCVVVLHRVVVSVFSVCVIL